MCPSSPCRSKAMWQFGPSTPNSRSYEQLMLVATVLVALAAPAPQLDAAATVGAASPPAEAATPGELTARHRATGEPAATPSPLALVAPALKPIATESGAFSVAPRSMVPRDAANTSDADEDPAADVTPVPDERKVEFTIGAQAWLRGEGRFNPAFAGASRQQRGRALQRLRLQGRGGVGPVAAFVQVQDARVWGSESSTTANAANVDLHQGYFELGDTTDDERFGGSLRAGRQEISYGTMRLIGHLPWAPGARSFDAIRGSAKLGKFGVDAFAAILDTQQDFTVEETGARTTNDGSQLYAAQGTADLHALLQLEALVLATRQRPTAAAPMQDRTIVNPDVHLSGALRGFTYDAEASYQAGTNNRRVHRAWAFATFAGYRFEHVTAKPGFRAGYAAASGDRCVNAPEDGNGCGAARSTEFYNFFPTNHPHYGLLDLAGWRNITDVDIRGVLTPIDELNVAVAYHRLELQQPGGPWKSAGGALVGAGWDPDNRSQDLGHEIEGAVTYKPLEGLMVQSGYGAFIPGRAARALGATEPQHFLWLWLVFNIDYRLGG